MKKAIAILLVSVFLATMPGCKYSDNARQSAWWYRADISEPPSAQGALTVTSGETTIYPLGHWSWSTTYDEQTGQALHGDAFPYLSEWEYQLESVTYAPNFSFWVSDENAVLSFNVTDDIASHSSNDIWGSTSYEDIAALPAGEYTVTCFLVTQGDYVKKAGSYNTSGDVYWFKLIKP